MDKIQERLERGYRALAGAMHKKSESEYRLRMVYENLDDLLHDIEGQEQSVKRLEAKYDMFVAKDGLTRSNLIEGLTLKYRLDRAINDLETLKAQYRFNMKDKNELISEITDLKIAIDALQNWVDYTVDSINNGGALEQQLKEELDIHASKGLH